MFTFVRIAGNSVRKFHKSRKVTGFGNTQTYKSQKKTYSPFFLRIMSDILNLGSFTSTGELVQQLALLNWLKKNDADSRQTYERVTGFRVVTDIWSRINGQDKIDAAQAKAIMAISEYVKKNPKASKAELTRVVSEEIQAFAATVDAL